jgi:hypothetical protein
MRLHLAEVQGCDSYGSWVPPFAGSMNVKERKNSIEESENLEQKQSRERARKVERSRDGRSVDRKDLDPSPNQRTVQPSDRTRKSS